MKNNAQGFTLIELLIVIAIIGILAAVLIPNLLGAQRRAYDTGAASCAKSIQTGQATAQIDSQGYFAVTKAGGTAVAPTLAAGSLAAAPTNIDLAVNCGVKEMVVATVGAVTGAAYTVTVRDTRGAKIYTATANDLQSAPAPVVP